MQCFHHTKGPPLKHLRPPTTFPADLPPAGVKCGITEVGVQASPNVNQALHAGPTPPYWASEAAVAFCPLPNRRGRPGKAPTEYHAQPDHPNPLVDDARDPYETTYTAATAALRMPVAPPKPPPAPPAPPASAPQPQDLVHGVTTQTPRKVSTPREALTIAKEAMAKAGKPPCPKLPLGELNKPPRRRRSSSKPKQLQPPKNTRCVTCYTEKHKDDPPGTVPAPAPAPEPYEEVPVAEVKAVLEEALAEAAAYVEAAGEEEGGEEVGLPSPIDDGGEVEEEHWVEYVEDAPPQDDVVPVAYDARPRSRSRATDVTETGMAAVRWGRIVGPVHAPDRSAPARAPRVLSAAPPGYTKSTRLHVRSPHISTLHNTQFHASTRAPQVGPSTHRLGAPRYPYVLNKPDYSTTYTKAFNRWR